MMNEGKESKMSETNNKCGDKSNGQHDGKSDNGLVDKSRGNKLGQAGQADIIGTEKVEGPKVD